MGDMRTVAPRGSLRAEISFWALAGIALIASERVGNHSATVEGLVAVGLAAAAAYVHKPLRPWARFYRATMTVFILAIYGILLLFAAQRDVSS